MNIIFLDMDGVLNNRSSMILYGVFKYGPDHMDTVDKTCVAWLYYLVKLTKAKIVISSSWRGRTKESSHHVRKAFEWAGFPQLWDVVIDVTPKHWDGFRGREIQEWLTEWNVFVDNYVVFDDDSYDITQKEHFIHVQHEYGLQWEHIEKAIPMLGWHGDISDIKNEFPRRAVPTTSIVPT